MLLSRGFYPMTRGWGHMGEVGRLRQEMDKLFSGLMDQQGQTYQSGVFPPINVYEQDGTYVLTAELPGVSGADLDISVQGKTVNIKGERKAPAPADNVKYHRREREFASFSRAVGLPDELDADKVEAQLKNGVLTLALPKAASAQPRKIQVN